MTQSDDVTPSDKVSQSAKVTQVKKRTQSDKVTDVPVATLVTYRSTRLTIEQLPGRICARALLAIASSSLNRR